MVGNTTLFGLTCPRRKHQTTGKRPQTIRFRSREVSLTTGLPIRSMTQKNLTMGSIASKIPAASRVSVRSGLASVEACPADAGPAVNEGSLEELIHHIDDLDLGRFLVAADGFGSERFGFVVTPN